MGKKCSKCKAVKPFESFGKLVTEVDGLQIVCKDCLKAIRQHAKVRQPPFNTEMCLWWLRQA